MDRKLTSLIRKYANIINRKQGCLLAINDYGIGHKANYYLDSLRENFVLINRDVDIIYHGKVNEQITAARVASLVARHVRLSKLQELERVHRLKHQGETLGFGEGKDDDQTMRWLEAYRKQYPHFEFPNLVRRDWKKLQEFESKFPKKQANIDLVCAECRNSYAALMYYDSECNEILYFCPKCRKKLDKNGLKESGLCYVLCDASAYVVPEF